MTIHLSDEILAPLRLTEKEVLLELSIAFYAAGKLSFGKARELAGLDWVQFRQALSERDIPAHYNQEDFEADLSAVEALSASE
jgi:predicted HTH domain antitoxin